MIGARWSLRTVMLLGAAIAFAHPALADTPAADTPVAQNVTYVFQGAHVTTDPTPPAMPAVKPTPVEAEALPAPAGVKTSTSKAPVKVAVHAGRKSKLPAQGKMVDYADASHGLPKSLPAPVADDRMAINNIDSALPQFDAQARGGSRLTLASLDSATQAPPDYISAIHGDIAEARAHPLPSSLNHAANLPIDNADAAPVSHHHHAALTDDDNVAFAAPQSLIATDDVAPSISHADYVVADAAPVMHKTMSTSLTDDDAADLATYTAQPPRDDDAAPTVAQAPIVVNPYTIAHDPQVTTIRTYATPLVPPSATAAPRMVAENCQPFTGTHGRIAGTACRGPDGMWRIREEHRVARPRMTQVASNWPRFGIGF